MSLVEWVGKDKYHLYGVFTVILPIIHIKYLDSDTTSSDMLMYVILSIK